MRQDVRSIAVALSFICSIPLSGQTPQTAAPAPVRVGGAIAPPTRVRYVQPVYPPDAKAAGLQGVVFIEAILGADGRVTTAKVTQGVPVLNEAALEAVRQWQYTSTYVNGQAVPVVMTVTVNFALGAGGGLPGGRGASISPAYDLTGEWIGDDGARYQVRTVGNELFWSGRNDAAGLANVFYGVLSTSGAYMGRWADVPPARFRGGGVMSVRAVSADRMEVVGESPAFSGRSWQRATGNPGGAAIGR